MVLPLTRVRWRHRRRRFYSVPVLYLLGGLFLSWGVPALDRTADIELTGAEGDITGYVFESGTVANTLSAVASGMIAFSGLVFTLLLLFACMAVLPETHPKENRVASVRTDSPHRPLNRAGPSS